MDDQFEFVKLSDLQFADVRQMISTVLELDWIYMKKWAIILGTDKLLKKAKGNE